MNTAATVMTMPHADTIDYSITENEKGKLVVLITKIEEITFSKRDVEIPGSKFKQLGVEAPSFWSDTAVKIVASKYFRGHDDKRENSVKQLVGRVTGAIVARLVKDDRFASDHDAHNFGMVLCHLLFVQAFAFNSPVWFNLGATETPQCSACFILGVDDTMESLLGWVYDEGMVFRRGSGSGASLSRIRHKNARLSSGGFASGPLSFAGGADKMAGAIKSGGTTRRAAKMLVLDDKHPDIEEFIDLKSVGEKVAKALIAAGFDSQFNAEGGAYDLSPWQNGNNSFRASDLFMSKVTGEDGDDSWPLLDVVDNSIVKTISAKGLWRKLCEAAWISGDPGIQWDDTINSWNPALASGRIRASNPCCFTGETLVDTSEGKISIEELVRRSQRGEELPMVWAFDVHSSLPVLRRIVKGWKAGEVTNLVRVTTDRGIVVLCTPEHRWLKRDGSWVEAQHLKTGDSLRKTARWVNEARSGRHCLNMRATASAPNGTVWQNRYMWEQAHGPIPVGMEVHHKNGDPTDDRLSNFELVPMSEHRSEHTIGSENPRFIDVEDHVLVEAWDTIAANRKRGSGVTPATWNMYIRDNGLNGQLPMAASPTNDGRIQGMPWSAFENKINELRSLVNDRVASVEAVTVDSAVSVFDLEVEGVHNFSVSSPGAVHSLVVHNSEYMFLDDTACNLASFNLVRYAYPLTRLFAANLFKRDTKLMYLCLDTIVDLSSYPTPAIDETTRKYRTLGAGYANLGGMLMRMGISYDSDAGRSYAAQITSLLGSTMYENSVRFGQLWGSFAEFEKNKNHVAHVIERHAAAGRTLQENDPHHLAVNISQERGDTSATRETFTPGDDWARVSGAFTRHSALRNAQQTVLAPTGTIGFMMDVDTTGIEPEIALVKYKTMVGGGSMKLVNTAVVDGLRSIGYDDAPVARIKAYLEKNTHLEGCPDLQVGDLAVFDTSFKAFGGTRFLSSEAHLLMMAAAQPFLSGAISKTVNMPEDATVEDIMAVYERAWRLEIKAVALYRDNCKQSQPLNTTDTSKKTVPETQTDLQAALKESQDNTDKLTQQIRSMQEGIAVVSKLEPAIKVNSGLARGERERLPDTRTSVTHKFSIGGQHGYLTVGFYPDGRIGEIFAEMSKDGSTVAGFLSAFSKSFSLMLQYGVSVEHVIEKFEGSKFEPSGWTTNDQMRNCSSVVDYIAKYLKLLVRGDVATPVTYETKPVVKNQSSMFGDLLNEVSTSGDPLNENPRCVDCRGKTKRAGSCFTCVDCGSTTGCG